MKTQGEHIRTLRRRVDFLQARDHKNSYDQAELGALEWALVNLPPAQKPQRWAVFCQGCRKEWSVSYPHPGKDICVDCDDKPAQQEPVAWEQFYPDMGKPELAYLPPTESPENACYAPSQRTWVGLSHEEIDYQAKKDDHAVYFALGALWAEAKLKEKNNG